MKDFYEKISAKGGLDMQGNELENCPSIQEDIESVSGSDLYTITDAVTAPMVITGVDTTETEYEFTITSTDGTHTSQVTVTQDTQFPLYGLQGYTGSMVVSASDDITFSMDYPTTKLGAYVTGNLRPQYTEVENAAGGLTGIIS